MQAENKRSRLLNCGSLWRSAVIGLVVPISNVDEVPSDRRRCRHFRRYQMCTAPSALSSFKITIAGRSAPLSRFKLIRVHCKAHTATRFSPFKSGVEKNLIQSLCFSLPFYDATAGDDHCTHPGFHSFIFDNFGRGSSVFDSGVGTGANKDPVHSNLSNGSARGKSHVIQSGLD